MIDHTLLAVLLSVALGAPLGHPTPAGLLLAFMALQGDYGLFSSVISTLRGIGLAASGVGLTVAILIKGSAATNGDRHALAARVAQNAFAGLFLVLLGWFIYDRLVEWTPL